MANHEVKAIAITGSGFESRWNVKMYEYEMLVDGARKKVDFQDMMVNIAENQALAIEEEVKPESVRIQKRTARLKVCGDAMAQLAEFKFNTKDNANPDSDNSCKISQATHDILIELGGPDLPVGTNKIKKAAADSGNQYLKSESDKLNNDQQLAMSRMETLVQGRDQNFNMASTLMQHVSEVRGSTIKSMG